MRSVTEHGFTTYPRRFDSYRWYKPILVGLIFITIYFAAERLITLSTKYLLGVTVESTGYDDLDVFTAAGAFVNTAIAAAVIPSLIVAALIVRDRPVSSYFSSMGGWRWKVFFKTLAAAVVLMAVPNVIFDLITEERGSIKFTIAGFILITVFCPLQGVAEEMMFRSYMMQTVSSWCKIPVVGIIVQIIIFTVAHQYNVIGLIGIAISALLYALVCVFSKGIESSSAMHMVNNLTAIYMAGFGVGSITSEQTIRDQVINIITKLVFFLFILFADRKLHWFDEVKRDDVAPFNAKYNAKHKKA